VLLHHVMLLPTGSLPLTVKGTVQRHKVEQMFGHALTAARHGTPLYPTLQPSSKTNSELERIVGVVQRYTTQIVSASTRLPDLTIDSTSAHSLASELRTLAPSLGSQALTQDLCIADLVKRSDRPAHDGPHKLPAGQCGSVMDVIGGLNVLACFYILAWHYLPVHGWDDAFAKPLSDVNSYLGDDPMNYFVMASAFVTQMHSPLNILQRAKYVPFVSQRLIYLYPTFILAMTLSMAIGDAWFEAGTGSLKFLGLCLTSLRWYLPSMDLIDGSDFCPNTVSWTFGTLMLWWALLPLLQLPLLHLESHSGHSLVTTVCISLVIAALQPAPAPYGFPLPYGPPFVCGLLAARQFKLALHHQSSSSSPKLPKLASGLPSLTPASCADGCIVIIVVISSLRNRIWSWLHFEARKFITPLLAIFLNINAHSGVSGFTASFLQWKRLVALNHCTLEVFLFQAPLHRLVTRCANLPDWYSRWHTGGFHNPVPTIPFVTYVVLLYCFSSYYERQVREYLARSIADCWALMFRNCCAGQAVRQRML